MLTPTTRTTITWLHQPFSSNTSSVFSIRNTTLHFSLFATAAIMQGTVLFSIESRMVLGSTQPSIQGIRAVKRTGLMLTTHLVTWLIMCGDIPPLGYTSSWHGVKLMKHEYTLTFTLILCIYMQVKIVRNIFSDFLLIVEKLKTMNCQTWLRNKQSIQL